MDDPSDDDVVERLQWLTGEELAGERRRAIRMVNRIDPAASDADQQRARWQGLLALIRQVQAGRRES